MTMLAFGIANQKSRVWAMPSGPVHLHAYLMGAVLAALDANETAAKKKAKVKSKRKKKLAKKGGRK